MTFTLTAITGRIYGKTHSNVRRTLQWTNAAGILKVVGANVQGWRVRCNRMLHIFHRRDGPRRRLPSAQHAANGAALPRALLGPVLGWMVPGVRRSLRFKLILHANPRPGRSRAEAGARLLCCGNERATAEHQASLHRRKDA